MKVWQAVILNISLLILIGLAIVFYVIYDKKLKECSTKQSTFCLNLACPYDRSVNDPSVNHGCGNYAYRQLEDGTYECALEGLRWAGGEKT